MFNKDVIIRVRAQIEGIRPRLYIYIYISIFITVCILYWPLKPSGVMLKKKQDYC